MTGVKNVQKVTSNGEGEDMQIKAECSEINSEEENENNLSNSESMKQVQLPTFQQPTYSLWTSKATACLINQYKKYRSMVGQSTQFKSLRDMFEAISREMQKYGYFFSPQKCENKWRVLERKYKNLVLRETMNKPGRIKHYGHWEHKRAMDEIFIEKKKSYYLNDNSYYSSVSDSTKGALISSKSIFEQNGNKDTQQVVQTNKKSVNLSNSKSADPVKHSPNASASENASTDESLSFYFNKFLIELKKHFDTAEENKDRRHAEMIAIRQKELQIQERLLMLKEQKLMFEKKKIIAMANDIQLTM